MKEKQVSWWCSLKPGFACFNLLWLESATTPNLSEKKNWLQHSFWILFSLDLWCSNRFNYTYYSSNCPIWYDVWPMDKNTACRLNKSTSAYCKSKLQRKKNWRKKKKKSASTRHWFDDSYMFIIIRNELVYYLSPVLTPRPPPIYPPDHPAAPSRDYLQTNYLLKPTKRPSTFDIVSPTPRGKRNNWPPYYSLD